MSCPGGCAGTSPCAKKNRCRNLTQFTIQLDYNSLNQISRIYIPPKLFGPTAQGTLSQGGIFTSDQGSDLVFSGLSSVTMRNTARPVLGAMNGTGFIAAGKWQSVPSANFGAGTKIQFIVDTDQKVSFQNLVLSNLNGANLNQCTFGTLTGWLATLTLTYF